MKRTFSTGLILGALILSCLATVMIPNGLRIQNYNAGEFSVWTCTNSTTGDGHWGTNLSGLNLLTLNITNQMALFATPEKWYRFQGGGQIGEGLVVSNAAGVAMEWYNNEVRIMGTLGLGGAVVTNNIGFQVGTVSGTGGANTNFTIQASGDESIIYVNAGTTNVNIVAIMGYSSTIAYRGTIVLTNRTGTSRTFSLGTTTNNWISLQKYDGINAPFTVTNSQAGRFSWEILGTNVQYSYKPMDLPSS